MTSTHEQSWNLSGNRQIGADAAQTKIIVISFTALKGKREGRLSIGPEMTPGATEASVRERVVAEPSTEALPRRHTLNLNYAFCSSTPESGCLLQPLSISSLRSEYLRPLAGNPSGVKRISIQFSVPRRCDCLLHCEKVEAH